jgi:hypothetical protein
VADLTTAGIRLSLGDTASSFLPGTYQLNTPIAVGGEATTPVEKDSIAFQVQAGDGAQLQGTGNTALVLGPTGSVHLKGPGGVHLEGSLTVTQGSSKRSARVLSLVAGPFDLVFTPAPGGGWTVTGEVQSVAANDLQVAAPAGPGVSSALR